MNSSLVLQMPVKHKVHVSCNLAVALWPWLYERAVVRSGLRTGTWGEMTPRWRFKTRCAGYRRSPGRPQKHSVLPVFSSDLFSVWQPHIHTLGEDREIPHLVSGSRSTAVDDSWWQSVREQGNITWNWKQLESKNKSVERAESDLTLCFNWK